MIVENIATTHRVHLHEHALTEPDNRVALARDRKLQDACSATIAHVVDERLDADTAKAIQDKLDLLDAAFLFERSIDIETYDRHAEKLREELTLARIDRH